MVENFFGNRSSLIKTVLGAGVAFSLAALTQSCEDSGTSPYAPAVSYRQDSIFAVVAVAIHPDSVVSDSGAVSGYSVAPPLPAGLSMDPATGIISGTPTDTASAMDYTVTAAGPNGTDKTVVNIAVYAPPPPALMTKGRDRYDNVCAFCHGPVAGGFPDQTPPLAASDFLMADKRRAIRIQLLGLPNASDTAKTISVNDSAWMKDMPSQNASDSEIAAVLTYVRANFNSGDVRSLDFVRVEEVAQVRDSLLARCVELGSTCNFSIDPEH